MKHEDSFVYLASINGLCALATAFPREIIEILMPEYIDMPNRADAEITIETRIKLGEILVKTTRALGKRKKTSSLLYILLHSLKNLSCNLLSNKIYQFLFYLNY